MWKAAATVTDDQHELTKAQANAAARLMIDSAAADLRAEIRKVDENCDKRSDATDAKIDRLLFWMLATMGTLLVGIATGVIVAVATS